MISELYSLMIYSVSPASSTFPKKPLSISEAWYANHPHLGRLFSFPEHSRLLHIYMLLSIEHSLQKLFLLLLLFMPNGPIHPFRFNIASRVSVGSLGIKYHGNVSWVNLQFCMITFFPQGPGSVCISLL